jgi:hypothetical protein
MITVDGVYVSRGESQSVSCSDRKNRYLADRASRKKSSRRYDGVISFRGNEIGAVEAAKKYEGEHSTKRILDMLKLQKVLHDMLACLESLAPTIEDFSSLHVVGLYRRATV